MGYKSLIQNNINNAFNSVKDLATIVTLTKKSDVTFDFSTNAPTSTASTITAKLISTLRKKNSEKDSSVKRYVIFRTSEVGDLSVYDSFVEDGVTWKFGPIISNNGFTVTAEVFEYVP